MNVCDRIKRLEHRAGLGKQWPFVLSLLDVSAGGMTPQQEQEFEAAMQRDRPLASFLDRVAESAPA